MHAHGTGRSSAARKMLRPTAAPPLSTVVSAQHCHSQASAESKHSSQAPSADLSGGWHAGHEHRTPLACQTLQAAHAALVQLSDSVGPACCCHGCHLPTNDACLCPGSLLESLPDSLLQALQESSLVAEHAPSLASRAAAAAASRSAEQHQRLASNQGTVRPSAHLTDPQGTRSQVSTNSNHAPAGWMPAPPTWPGVAWCVLQLS